MPSRDPRVYVKAMPLPISSQKGLKLQARTADVFNPTTPTREEVRKWNYDRRVQQMSEQGFNACNYKPYKGIGDPIYLDNKKLILHSLGQWDENQEVEASATSENDEDQEVPMKAVPQASLTAAKFVLKRTRKDLNTLNKEVAKGRQLIRNVSLGHGLFYMIKQERHLKKAALIAEKQRSLEEARRQWQPPKDSSDEETSDDLDRDEDSENFYETSTTDSLSEDIDLTFPSATNSAVCRSKSASTKTQSQGKKKKQVTPRPFTPQYNNLLEISEDKDDLSKSALFRQLCALNWILDAMNIDQGYSMGPISTCWSHLEIGGSKISAKRVREEKRAETDWERWLNNQQIVRIGKKGSITRLNRLSRSSRLLSHPRISLQSRSASPSSSSSQTLSAHPVASLPTSSQTNAVTQQASLTASKDVIPESRVTSPTDPADEETLQKTGIFKFLDEYYESLRREEEKKKEANAGSPSPQNINNQQPSSEERDEKVGKRGRESKSGRKSKTLQDRQQTPDKLSRSPEVNLRSRFILKDLRNTLNYRSKSSAELMEFHANKASNKYSNLRQDLQDKFKEIQEDKAMTLHDILEQMERYTDLLVNLPSEVKDIWYFETVIQKIGRYGLIENTSKQSVYKFLKVLEGLRHWEICNPDISAAIEFCRAKIVEMSVEEYEEWFSQAFPKVVRPKTAPAVLRDHRQGSSSKQDTVKLIESKRG